MVWILARGGEAPGVKQVSEHNGQEGPERRERGGALPPWRSSQDPERPEQGPEDGREEWLRAEIAGLRAAVQSLERERDALRAELDLARSAALPTPGPAAPARDLRDQLLAMVSHELRTPLQSLNMGLGLLLSRFRATSDEIPRPWAVSRLERSQRNAARLTQLVETLLDVSRMREGKLELQLADVDLAEVARRVVARAREDLGWAGCACSVSTPGPVVGRWDPARLDLVVSNLLSNAMKYGAGRPVQVTVEGDEARARITVRDQGNGIAPEDHERIFDRFERTSSASSVPGLGLGLWIVKHVVEAMGGSVRVESRPGEGSAFTVLLPRAPA